MAPELLDPQCFGCNCCPTCESGYYALGMVIYVGQRIHYDRPSLINPQVLTGRRPFHRIFGCTPVPVVPRVKHSEKPFDIQSLGPSETFLGSVQSCCSGSHPNRPTPRRLLEYLSTACLIWIPPACPIIQDVSTSKFCRVLSLEGVERQNDSCGSSGWHLASVGHRAGRGE